MAPCLEINLKKIEHNEKILEKFFAQRNISIIGVSKVVLGEPKIARSLVKAGIEYIGDSRIENIIKMKNVGNNLSHLKVEI